MKGVRIDAQATALLDEWECNALRGERVYSTGRERMNFVALDGVLASSHLMPQCCLYDGALGPIQPYRADHVFHLLDSNYSPVRA